MRFLPTIDCYCLHLCREADKDMVIMGYRIPQGTPLMLAPYPMHVSPHNYIHPHKFWPDRWLAEPIAEDILKQSGSGSELLCCFLCNRRCSTLLA